MTVYKVGGVEHPPVPETCLVVVGQPLAKQLLELRAGSGPRV